MAFRCLEIAAATPWPRDDGKRYSGRPSPRHCEERSDDAISRCLAPTVGTSPSRDCSAGARNDGKAGETPVFVITPPPFPSLVPRTTSSIQCPYVGLFSKYSLLPQRGHGLGSGITSDCRCRNASM